MDEQSLVDQLSGFGLSETQARAYLCVVEHGEATMTTIAEEADLSRRYVYELVEDLAEQGFVDLNDHVTPAKVHAKQPDDVIESLKDDIDAIAPDLKERWSTAETEPLGIEIHKSRVTIVDRLNALVSEASGEVVFSLPAALLSEVEDELRAARERGVMVALLLWRTDPDEFPVNRLEGVASVARASPYWAPMALTIDFDRAGLSPPEHIFFEPNSDFQAIEAREHLPVYQMRATILSQEWPAATEIYAREPTKLPWTSSWFVQAPFQVALHKREGTRLRARIVGRQVDRQTVNGVVEVPREGEFEPFDARVVDARQRFLDPLTNTHPVENALVVDRDGTEVTVGGVGAYLEDYEAKSVRLERLE